MAEKKLDIRVYPIDEPKGNTKAFASIAVNDLIAIRGVRVVDSEKGLFVTMPQSLDKSKNEYHDIAFPLNGDLRKEIIEAVLNEYKRVSVLAPEQRIYEKPEVNTANNIKAADIKLDIRVYPINEPKGGTKAFASVSIDDSVAIRGIRVVDGDKGMFIQMPQSKDKKDEYHDVAFPLNGDLRKEISKEIIKEYKSAEKSVEKKQTLAEGLRDGAAKAAEHTSAPREASAKSRAGALE